MKDALVDCVFLKLMWISFLQILFRNISKLYSLCNIITLDKYSEKCEFGSVLFNSVDKIQTMKGFNPACVWSLASLEVFYTQIHVYLCVCLCSDHEKAPWSKHWVMLIPSWINTATQLQTFSVNQSICISRNRGNLYNYSF